MALCYDRLLCCYYGVMLCAVVPLGVVSVIVLVLGWGVLYCVVSRGYALGRSSRYSVLGLCGCPYI